MQIASPVQTCKSIKYQLRVSIESSRNHSVGHQLADNEVQRLLAELEAIALVRVRVVTVGAERVRGFAV